MSRGRRVRDVNANHVAREHAVILVRQTLERFTLDLAKLLAGHPVEFADSAAPETEERLRAAVQPFLRSGARLSPDFGQFAEASIQGDVLAGTPLRCSVCFEDRSSVVLPDGDRKPGRRRAVEMRLVVAGSPPRVTDCAFPDVH